MALSCGLLLAGDRIAALDRASEAIRAESAIRFHGDLRIPAGDADDLLRETLAPQRIEIEVPPELGIEELVVEPVPVMRIANGYPGFYGVVSFDYGGHIANANTRGAIYVSHRQRIRRDFDREAAALKQCAALGADVGDGEASIAKGRVATVACALAEAGWRVEAEGKRYRKAGSFSMSVASGIDWFEVDGTIEFDGTALPLAELAEAMGKGERVVTLADGSIGVMPLARMRDLASFEGYDLVLTTYGIVRSDAALLANATFDTVILDESQAIKNASTQTAKAIRLLSGRQRLALTGTPIENHIGELWSLMEFLNPGLLGSSAAFQRLVSSKRLDDVLEALLGLRQAACHPRLIEHSASHSHGDSGVKFEALLPQLEEIMREGHKALVFSQFTELLALLRKELDARGTSYAYLDGKSRDRAVQVQRFQTDPSLRLFLISLKAGGVGLNLTAADYVFLLDPWWNPAVEAQAIDRTHRIGQTRSVFAYRLVVRRTVEEKILELQAQKRDLVESILGGSGSLASELTAEDVERLLS